MTEERMGWSTRPNGERVRVRIVSPPGVPARRRRSEDAFAMIPLAKAAKIYKATHQPKAMVVALLYYEAWKAKGKPFKLSNERLEAYGVKRWTKYRAFAEMEANGIIQVEWRGKEAPIITLL